MTIWESGAILEYLVAKYDKDHAISFTPNTEDFYYAKQWLMFQMSGQGPYYGQAIWFYRFHAEKIPSAYERYFKEIKRVSAVFNEQLKKNGGWLVGDKFSYVDLAAFYWQNYITTTFGEGSEYHLDLSEFADVTEWLEKIRQRSSVAKSLAQ